MGNHKVFGEILVRWAKTHKVRDGDTMGTNHNIAYGPVAPNEESAENQLTTICFHYAN